jgi:carbamoyltransferase
VIQDGRLVFAAEEERFTRHKHSPHEPPLNALKAAYRYLLNGGIKPKDVDAYAVNFDPALFTQDQRRFYFNLTVNTLIRHKINITGSGSTAKALFKLVPAYIKSDYLFMAKSVIRTAIHEIGEEVPAKLNIHPVRHHLAHAASAYYFSGFSSATAMIVDGIGEIESTSIWKIKDGDFELISSVPAMFGSIGALYEVASIKVGYERLEGPGKLMGLAPYGSEYGKFLDRLSSFFKLLDDPDIPYKLDRLPPNNFLKDKNNGGDRWERIWRWHLKLFNEIVDDRISWNPKGSIDLKASAIARAMQEFTNKLFVHLGRYAKEHTNEDKVVLAGGVTLNARANMELYYSKIFNDMFIFPAANDSGTAIGAAAYVYEHVLGGKMKNERLKSVYLGPKYEDDVIKKLVEDAGVDAEYIGDDVGPVAEIAAKGAVVAWYQGRAELGPRALGNRSIIADPRRKDYWRMINDIKGREWWRPLAPSLLDDNKERYFQDPISHEFMVMMFKYRDKEICERVPVVCHIDMTARPQTVTRDQNKTWYDLIKAFKEFTGEGIVMNTSFNLAGEPLVETPREALIDFFWKKFDALYLQGWLIYKRRIR